MEENLAEADALIAGIEKAVAAGLMVVFTPSMAEES